MLHLRRIAITGGVASGKTTVAQQFAACGAYVVSCDALVHQLLSPQHPIGQRVEALLGPDVWEGDSLDRTAIADRIFRDPVLRHQVEQILHPAVWEMVAAEYAKCPRDQLFVVEVPLLFEVEAETRFDSVICVDTPVERSRQWVMAHGGDIEEFERREQAQIPREEKARRADTIISNLGDQEALRRKATALYTHLTQ